ncbi:MAG: LapA family protein [Thermosulfidibacteraceae bacterium]|jgi:uncharacterized integral membrane protein
MRYLVFFLWLIFFFLFVGFAVLNMHPVKVSLYFYEFQNIPLFMVIIASILVGAISSWLYSITDHIKLRWKLREKDKEIKELQKRLRELDILSKQSSQIVEQKTGQKIEERRRDEGGTGEGV